MQQPCPWRDHGCHPSLLGPGPPSARRSVISPSTVALTLLPALASLSRRRLFFHGVSHVFLHDSRVCLRFFRRLRRLARTAQHATKETEHQERNQRSDGSYEPHGSVAPNLYR